jgi:hypothetical protein
MVGFGISGFNHLFPLLVLRMSTDKLFIVVTGHMKIEWQYYQFIVDSNPTVSRWALHELRI